jgi:glycosyltransferase involved in cell wall biosynthesis
MRRKARDSSSDNPLVSVITVVRNAGHAIEQTICSVAAQTYGNVEYIVVDGQSTDATLDIIRRYDADIDYWVSEADRGIYDAMNKGVALCNGEFIGIIGAGDWYESDAIEKVVATFRAGGADVVYGDVEIVDGETGLAYWRRSRSDLMPRTMSSISHTTTFVRRPLFGVRPFDETWKIAGDYDFCLGLYVAGHKFVHAGGAIAHFRIGGASSSRKTAYEVFRVHRKYLGSVHATRELVRGLLWRSFFDMRRRAVMSILSPEQFAAARAWWIRQK